jgi:hypothetical protein
VLATGNDFRVVKPGFMPMLQNQVSYAYLTLKSKMVFTFWLEIPLALGTGWTNYFTSVSCYP